MAVQNHVPTTLNHVDTVSLNAYSLPVDTNLFIHPLQSASNIDTRMMLVQIISGPHTLQKRGQ